MNNLKDLKNYIISTTKDEWTTLEKIRHVYVTAGKYLEKNTDFFLTIQRKIKHGRLSSKKLDKIYLNKLGNRKWKRVICKSAAEFLDDIYKSLGIESKVVRTVGAERFPGMKNDIYHFFVVASDGENNYFLTLVPDIGYIQNNMRTHRFATDVPFMVKDENGNDVKYYEADEEIPHKILTPKEIRKLDEKIGYLNTVYTTNDKPKTMYSEEELEKNKNFYLDLLCKETYFYNKIFPMNEDFRIIKSIVNATPEEWNKLINLICMEVGKKVGEICKAEYVFNSYITEDNFNEWISYISSLYDKKAFNQKEVIYSNPTLLINKTIGLCKNIYSFSNKKIPIKDIKNEVISFRNSFINKVNEISKHFVDPRFLIEPKNKNRFVSNVYMNKRLDVLFKYLFNANSGFREEFNRKSYSEQIEIIKYMIINMFADLNENNLIKDKNDYDTKIEIIYNRINIFSIREKNTDNYSCYIVVTEKNGEVFKDAFWHRYDIKANKLTTISPVNAVRECSKNGKYEMLSERLKNIIDKIELNGSYAPKKR